MALATMVTSPKGGEECFPGGRVFPHPKTKHGTIPGGRGSQGLWGSYWGKPPIVFCVHTDALGTGKGYLNRAEEVITPTTVW